VNTVAPIRQLSTAAPFVLLMMATTGYSGTPLIKKPGIKPTMKLLLLNAPPNYYSLLEEDISKQLCSAAAVPDFIHAFVSTKKELATCIKQCKKFAVKIQQLLSGYPGIKKQRRSRPMLQKMLFVPMHCLITW
jgi:hypothetical protein